MSDNPSRYDFDPGDDDSSQCAFGLGVEGCWRMYCDEPCVYLHSFFKREIIKEGRIIPHCTIGSCTGVSCELLHINNDGHIYWHGHRIKTAKLPQGHGCGLTSHDDYLHANTVYCDAARAARSARAASQSMQSRQIRPDKDHYD